MMNLTGSGCACAAFAIGIMPCGKATASTDSAGGYIQLPTASSHDGRYVADGLFLNPNKCTQTQLNKSLCKIKSSELLTSDIDPAGLNTSRLHSSGHRQHALRVEDTLFTISRGATVLPRIPFSCGRNVLNVRLNFLKSQSKFSTVCAVQDDTIPPRTRFLSSRRRKCRDSARLCTLKPVRTSGPLYMTRSVRTPRPGPAREVH